jgi:hypothetical protein
MKIGIITGYYSENSGTLLQAYSTGRIINQLGYETVYISTRNKYSTHSIKYTIGRFIKELLHGKVNNAITAIKKYHNFAPIIKQFNVIDIEDVTNYGVEKFVVGSDTVWNVEDRYFKEAHKQYWPMVDNIKVVSYAAAIGNCSLSTFEQLDYPRKCLNNMDMISVRDNYSKGVIEAVADKPVTVVCDPTILIDLKEFDVFKKKIYTPQKYILVYIFEELDMKIVNEIVTYAEKNNMQIISLGKQFKWCNRQATISVENFISYYSNAEYVITNTFHGNVFAVLYKKQFICAPCEKIKVIELLASFGLGYRRISSAEDMKIVILQQIDYEQIDLKVKELKMHSMHFLTASLKI